MLKGTLFIVGSIIYIHFFWKSPRHLNEKTHKKHPSKHLSKEAVDFSDRIYTYLGRLAAILMICYGVYLWCSALR